MSGTTHINFESVTIHTARCDVCDKRNQGQMRRCVDCGWKICTPCFEQRRGDLNHHMGSNFWNSLVWASSIPPGSEPASNATLQQEAAPAAPVAIATVPTLANKPAGMSSLTDAQLEQSINTICLTEDNPANINQAIKMTAKRKKGVATKRDVSDDEDTDESDGYQPRMTSSGRYAPRKKATYETKDDSQSQFPLQHSQSIPSLSPLPAMGKFGAPSVAQKYRTILPKPSSHTIKPAPGTILAQESQVQELSAVEHHSQGGPRSKTGPSTIRTWLHPAQSDTTLPKSQDNQSLLFKHPPKVRSYGERGEILTKQTGSGSLGTIGVSVGGRPEFAGNQICIEPATCHSVNPTNAGSYELSSWNQPFRHYTSPPTISNFGSSRHRQPGLNHVISEPGNGTTQDMGMDQGKVPVQQRDQSDDDDDNDVDNPEYTAQVHAELQRLIPAMKKVSKLQAERQKERDGRFPFAPSMQAALGTRAYANLTVSQPLDTTGSEPCSYYRKPIVSARKLVDTPSKEEVDRYLDPKERADYLKRAREEPGKIMQRETNAFVDASKMLLERCSKPEDFEKWMGTSYVTPPTPGAVAGAVSVDGTVPPPQVMVPGWLRGEKRESGTAKVERLRSRISALLEERQRETGA